MAIAYDNSTGSQKGDGNSSYSFSHTVGSGANRGLFLITRSDEAITSAAYNGVAMTLLYSDNASLNTTVWFLANPATGAHNVTFNIVGYRCSCVAISYSGLAQSGIADATSIRTGQIAETVTSSVTTTTDKTWGLLFCGQQNGNQPSAGTGVTYRNGASFGSAYQLYVYDTNSEITPAGSKSMTLTVDLSYHIVRMLAINPYVAAKPIYVRVGGLWKQAVTYVKVSGAWKQAVMLVKISGTWK